MWIQVFRERPDPGPSVKTTALVSVVWAEARVETSQLLRVQKGSWRFRSWQRLSPVEDRVTANWGPKSPQVGRGVQRPLSSVEGRQIPASRDWWGQGRGWQPCGWQSEDWVGRGFGQHPPLQAWGLGQRRRQADRRGRAGQSEEALGLALPPVRSDLGKSLLCLHCTFLGCKVKGLIPHSSGAFQLQANKKKRSSTTKRGRAWTGADICRPTFTAAIVTRAGRWKQCKCPCWMHGSAQCR